MTRDVIAVNEKGKDRDINSSNKLLESILQTHGKSQSDFSSIRLIASDGYSVDIPKQILDTRDIIITYMTNEEGLYDDSKPIRATIPGEREMYWVSSLKRIEFFEDENRDKKDYLNKTEKIFIFESVIKDLKVENYDYCGEIERVIHIEKLFDKYIEIEEDLEIKAADDLKKTESNQIFRDSYIKISGENSPMILGPKMRLGMTVKELLWFKGDKTVYLSMDRALEYYNERRAEGVVGISLRDVMDDLNCVDLEEYSFVYRKGERLRVSPDQIDKGIIYIDEEGSSRVSFEGLDLDKEFKDLLYIGKWED